MKREPRDIKIINLSNIKHGHLDRIINDSEKINSALKNQNLEFATPEKNSVETEVQLEKKKDYQFKGSTFGRHILLQGRIGEGLAMPAQIDG